MDALAEAIARQRAGRPPVIDANEALLEQRLDALAFEQGRPRAVAILAWCQEHPAEVGEHQDLVEELRVALATKQLYGPILLRIWGSIPETCDVEPATKAEG